MSLKPWAKMPTGPWMRGLSANALRAMVAILSFGNGKCAYGRAEIAKRGGFSRGKAGTNAVSQAISVLVEKRLVKVTRVGKRHCNVYTVAERIKAMTRDAQKGRASLGGDAQEVRASLMTSDAQKPWARDAQKGRARDAQEPWASSSKRSLKRTNEKKTAGDGAAAAAIGPSAAPRLTEETAAAATVRQAVRTAIVAKRAPVETQAEHERKVRAQAAILRAELEAAKATLKPDQVVNEPMAKAAEPQAATA